MLLKRPSLPRRAPARAAAASLRRVITMTVLGAADLIVAQKFAGLGGSPVQTTTLPSPHGALGLGRNHYPTPATATAARTTSRSAARGTTRTSWLLGFPYNGEQRVALDTGSRSSAACNIPMASISCKTIRCSRPLRAQRALTRRTTQRKAALCLRTRCSRRKQRQRPCMSPAPRPASTARRR